MKIIFDKEEIGKIAVDNDTYIVFYKWFDKEKKRPLTPKYFMTLKGALLELKKHNLVKHLASYNEPADSFKELLNRVKQFEEKWQKFLDENFTLQGDENEK